MRRVARKTLGLASICLTIMAMIAVGTFVLFDSDYGRAFLDKQTEAVVGRLLGPGYTAGIGRQSVDLGSKGQLMLRWNDVEVKRVGVSEPQAKVRSIAVGLDVFSLLSGRLETRSLDVSGVDVDVTVAPESVEVAAAAQGLVPADGVAPATPVVDAHATKTLLPALGQRLIGQAERRLDALRSIGIGDVTISDMRLVVPIAPGGGPFVARIEYLTLDLDDPRAMILSGVASVDGTPLPLDARIDFDPDTRRLVAGRSTVGPVSLSKLLPPAPPEDMKDMRAFGSDSDMTLTLAVSTRAEDGLRSARFGLELGPGHLQAGKGHIDVVSATLAFDYLEGQDRIAVGPNRIVSDGLDINLSGELSPVYDRPDDAGFNGFALALASTEMRSRDEEEDDRRPIDATLKLAGRTDLAAKTIRVGELDLRSGEGALTGSAVYRYGAPDAMTQVQVKADNLAASAVKAFWPFNLAVGTRRWVENNVGDAGRVAEGTVVLDLRKDRLAQSFRPGSAFQPGEMELDFALEGLRVRSFGELPDLIDAVGSVETHGTDTLISVSRASVEDLKDIAIDGGIVSFSRIPGGGVSPQTAVKIVVNAGGKLPGLLAAAARQPLNALSALSFEPKDVSGTAKTVADVDLVLGDDVPNGRILKGWHVSAELKDAALGQPIAGRRIADVDGNLQVRPGVIEGEVEGSVDGARSSLTFRRSLDPEPAGGKRMEAGLLIDAAEAAKLAPVLDDIVSGPIEAKIVEDVNAAYRTDVDLSGSTLTLPWIGWRKGKGVLSHLTFELKTGDVGTAVEDIVLKGDGFSASGKADADKSGIRSAELSDVVLNPGDNVHASVERVQNGFSMEIKGNQFDARPMLADIKNDIGAKTAKPPRRGTQQFDVSANVRKVIGFGDETIGDFALNYAGSGSRIAALSLAGVLKKKGRFSIDVSPRGDARAVEIKTTDAGALLDFSGAYGRMEGGKLSLSLLGSYEDGYKGDLSIKNFTLVDEPRLSRLVAAPPAPNSQSLSQAVGRDLKAERASFDHASAGITFGKGGLQLGDGIIRGPIFGSSFTGTLYDPQNRIDITGSFMPAYGLNRVFGQIPVLGQILGNGREGGLIGITYRLSGSFPSPKLEINPISAIAPGIFRNIFAYQ